MRPFVLLTLLTCAVASAQQTNPDESRQCAACHAKIYQTYQRTGMAQSFANHRTLPTVADFNHTPSNTHYALIERDSRYYQLRQTPFGDKEELSVDAVIGSGNHALTFLHRTQRGALLQLPLGWYAEYGGTWGMNPGYDATHPPARRPIVAECMFCHNAYPAGYSSATGEPVFPTDLPNGIDCARCHGPGAKHIATARTAGSPVTEIRAAIVNPSRLTKERQMEVCLQCHLETTSAKLPALVRRFDRDPFSYRPGDPLGNFILSFDHAPGAPHNDKFEIAGSAYRLRQSQCFLKSNGNLTCTTCHNPHDIPRAEEATVHYAQVCRQCHATLAATHPSDTNCVSCHMPKRRTDDVVHVAMTDHLIQRHPPTRDPLPAAEYSGEVIPYYPPAGDPLYTALAQVYQKTNLTTGIEQLASALRAQHPPQADFYTALGQAYEATGQPDKAIAAYRDGVRADPKNIRNLRALGSAAKDPILLRTVVDLSPQDAESWFQLGVILAARGQRTDATTALTKATQLNPDRADLFYDLGANLTRSGDTHNAETAFRQALHIDPSLAIAHTSLAQALADRAQLQEASFHAAEAVRLEPAFGPHRYQYAIILAQLNQLNEAERQARAAIADDAQSAGAHQLLGTLLSRRKDSTGALTEFAAAVRLKPDFSRAQLDLGIALAAAGNRTQALTHLQQAAGSRDPQIVQAARRAIASLN